jgi:hypothetical protein
LTKPPLLAQRDAGGVAAGVLPPELGEHLADVDGDAPEINDSDASQRALS